MAKKALRVLVMLTVAGLVLIGAVRWNASEEQKMQPVIAGEMSKPGDLSGDWTTKPDARLKFVAEIQAGTILIHMVNQNDTLAYYYGSFTTADAHNVFHSKKIDDGKLVWSNAVAKDFLWQNNSLIFKYEALGVTSAIELVREP